MAETIKKEPYSKEQLAAAASSGVMAFITTLPARARGAMMGRISDITAKVEAGVQSLNANSPMPVDLQSLASAAGEAGQIIDQIANEERKKKPDFLDTWKAELAAASGKGGRFQYMASNLGVAPAMAMAGAGAGASAEDAGSGNGGSGDSESGGGRGTASDSSYSPGDDDFSFGGMDPAGPREAPKPMADKDYGGDDAPYSAAGGDDSPREMNEMRRAREKAEAPPENAGENPAPPGTEAGDDKAAAATPEAASEKPEAEPPAASASSSPAADVAARGGLMQRFKAARKAEPPAPPANATVIDPAKRKAAAAAGDLSKPLTADAKPQNSTPIPGPPAIASRVSPDAAGRMRAAIASLKTATPAAPATPSSTPAAVSASSPAQTPISEPSAVRGLSERPDYSALRRRAEGAKTARALLAARAEAARKGTPEEESKRDLAGKHDAAKTEEKNPDASKRQDITHEAEKAGEKNDRAKTAAEESKRDDPKTAAAKKDSPGHAARPPSLRYGHRAAAPMV